MSRISVIGLTHLFHITSTVYNACDNRSVKPHQDKNNNVVVDQV